jgi:mannose-1-phosphate guanylyltransferase
VRALLLAAGVGTRLRPLTDRVPKCLVPIHGTPLLEYWFRLLVEAQVERILVNTHYLPEAVSRFVQSSRWHPQVDLVYEPELLGTGGTILRNRAFFHNQAFLVAHADNLSRFDVRSFIARHVDRPPNTAMTMMTFDTDAPQTCGIVEEDYRGVVVDFHEKVHNPPGRRANGAVYIFEQEVVDFIAALNKQIVDLSTEVIPHFVGRICTYHNSDYHRDIGTPESLRKAEEEFG